MVKRWSEMDAFVKTSVAMVLLWAICVCTIVAGYKVIGCVLIWLAVVIDVVAITLWNKVWKKRKERKDENNI